MKWLLPKHLIASLLIGAVFCSMRAGQCIGAEEAGPLVSGRAVGELVPSFYTRVVTGPLMNRSVCYVCRNGDRPVVMVFVRKLGPGVAPLFKQVDQLVDEHRAEGLRGFGVHVSEDPSEAIAEVQTFAFDHKVGLPLTVSSLAVADPDCQNLHEDAEVTVVLYQNQRVMSRKAFRAGDIPPEEIEAVAKAIRLLVAGRNND